MAGIMQPLREMNPIENVSSIPQILVSKTSTNTLPDNKYNAQHPKSLMSSKSYMHGLSNSAETLSNVPASNSAMANLALLGDISPNNTNFFEVMYVGKIRVSHKRVPPTFVDDALPKFKAYDSQRLLKLAAKGAISLSTISATIREDDEENGNENPEVAEEILPKRRQHSGSYGTIPPYVELNRTMVFLVGKSDLRLISPDRKKVILHKAFKDVANCCQGQTNGNHFGIICREVSVDGYLVYVFKCQSENVCSDILVSISQAIVASRQEEKSKLTNQSFSCEHCPVVWLQKLCSDIEDLGAKKAQAVIFRRIETLADDEQDTLWGKFYDAESSYASNISDQNRYILMLLREHCESKQQRHVHDTAENRSEFLNQYLGGSTIFMKAKRSLSNSLDHLLKRKGSQDIGSFIDLRERDNATNEKNRGDESSSNTGVSAQQAPTSSADQEVKAPMMDIFMKVGNSPKSNSAQQGSWRQAILNSVVAPADQQVGQSSVVKRSKEELRGLWKTAIRQTILLARMEKENANLLEKQNENEIKKIKLDYDTIIKCDRQLVERWEMIIERNSSKIANKRDPKVLLQAIKNGVPRAKRGDIWTFLGEQHSMNTAPVDTKKFPNFNASYQSLLKNLTAHQHAIFIDLGRTFPNHSYYKDPLGVGQLSLFNLLKAYSILDPELGYCQGLGFICGVLLLHCEEADAFQLLKHLMFRLKMRTKYLQDMKQFQLQLYQLSRLVKDKHPDLYNWLDQNDVAPTLYASPWILTIFSSQFPLGFVVRVFDLLFLESSEVIFKFAISILAVHKEELLKRDCFEDIMDYLKTTVTDMEAKSMEEILKLVFTMDIQKNLEEYKVEYNVLQEEITLSNHNLDLLNKEKEKSQYLENQLQFAQSSITQLEKNRFTQQSQITLLKTEVRQLELTIQTLGDYISEVLDHNIGLDLPEEVRRILQQLEDVEKQHGKITPTTAFQQQRFGKSLSDNSYLGHPLKILSYIERHKRIPNDDSKFGKSLSVSSNLGLGMPLQILKSNSNSKKTSYFENTYELLRQQKQASNPKLTDDAEEKKDNTMTHPLSTI